MQQIGESRRGPIWRGVREMEAVSVNEESRNDKDS